MNISFTEVEDIFKSYEVWVGGKELFWYRKAWNALEKGGLTSYSNSISKNEVVIRSFALILIYQEFCQ